MKAELDAITDQMTSNGDKFVPIYGTNSWQNVKIDESTFPVICYDLPSVIYETPKSGFIGETYPLTVFIAYKSELDWDGSQHEVVIEKANTAMREWISRIQGNKDASGNRILEIVKIGTANRVKCIFDVCCSGILVQMDIKPTITKSVCVE